ncbi:MAG TPA: nucleotidyl transferase AbiEii/AbiGii toxin family protein [Anaerolineales bacterium]|nr:nucleotidyl transferase AbiEii/AbiGii toxin family protein [Anaerolineales bacterium]
MSRSMQFKAIIRNMALKNRIPAQAVLQNFMLERLLERIYLSDYRDNFILKGGMLISSLVGIENRTTMDMDATLKGYPLDAALLERALQDICAVQVEDDAIFDLNQITPIRDDDEYGGYRAAITADYESIRVPLKIDLTVGDVITPRAIRLAYQSNFEDRVFDIWAYNLETILAEKIETILRRGALNTRMRDFYDVYIIAVTRQSEVDGLILKNALIATMQKRESLNAWDESSNLLAAIRQDAFMPQRWSRYAAENNYAKNITFEETLEKIRDILLLAKREADA